MRYIAWTTEAEIVNMQPNRVDAVFDDLMTWTACRSTFTQSCSPDIVKETGVPILIMDVTLHRANPPDAIKNQRVATAEQE